MTYRPYPSPDRARHQVARHKVSTPAMRLTMSPAMRRDYEQWAPLRGAFQADMARLAARSAAAGAAIWQAFVRPIPAPSDPGSGSSA